MSEEPDFTSLNMKISESIKNYPIETRREIHEYLSGLDEIHIKGYDIAYNHLGSSFNIARSNGFKKWLAEKSST